MPSERDRLLEWITKAKQKILDAERQALNLGEQETRQVLINPLLR